MTRRATTEDRPRAVASPTPSAGGTRGVILLGLVGVAVFAALGALFLRPGGGATVSLGADSGPVHVHGLGIDPADGALIIATHTGLFRVAEGARKAERIADRYQDTMGFTIVGPNRFLGSGHPDPREAQENDLPSLLGLIESTDAGTSWRSISLLGKADFHVLRSAGNRVYGYDASNDRLLRSGDRGRTWEELERPGPVLDLAVAPTDSRHVVLTSAGGHDEGVFESLDGGRSWSRVSDAVGLLAWAPKRLYLVAADGQVLSSPGGGGRFERRGTIGGEPAALVAEGESELYVALHDGTIKRSVDGGSTWTARTAP